MDEKLSGRNYLTNAEKEEAQQAFRIFDQDGSGSISIKVAFD
jgi:Ca2+-binding EF-hand superfamily protein